ncbi:MAG: SDR family NAD(P)-dependent oxidoreductase [Candidatus Bipolaricaulia bacterium]
MNNSDRKLALITGASSGIGEAFARRLAEQGYDLIITGRREERLKALAEELSQAYGVAVEVMVADLTDPQEIEALAKKVEATPELALLINNAGFGSRRRFHEEELTSQEAMVRVHILATLALTHAAIPNMIKKGRGAIINVSSLAAFAPLPKTAVYSGTKAFLSAFSEGLSLELARTGVKVQALCPGFTRTEFHSRLGLDPARLRNKGFVRWMTPEEVVSASLACLAKGRVICIPGWENKAVFHLLRLIPRRLYYKFAPGSGSRGRD